MIREGAATVEEGAATALVAASERGGRLILQARPGNEGTVRVGGVGVGAEDGLGIALAKGEVLPPFTIDDLGTLFIAGDKPGDGVTFIVSGPA
jgi:hypothetical protein